MKVRLECKFGYDFSAVWSVMTCHKIISANVFYVHIYTWANNFAAILSETES